MRSQRKIVVTVACAVNMRAERLMSRAFVTVARVGGVFIACMLACFPVEPVPDCGVLIVGFTVMYARLSTVSSEMERSASQPYKESKVRACHSSPVSRLAHNGNFGQLVGTDGLRSL